MSKAGIFGRLSFSRAEQAARQGSSAGMEKALRHLLDRSQAEVPRDTGALAHSGRIEQPDAFHGRVVYDAEYAIAQHERTDYAHPRGGKAKYLEDPANDAGTRSEMLVSLGEEIRKAFAG